MGTHAHTPFGSGVICCILFIIGVPVGGSKVDYAPGDTRLLDYSIFCQSLTAQYNNVSTSIGPSVLYGLSSEPQLTDMDSFGFNRMETLINTTNVYYEWNLHFHRGSSVEVSGCVDSSGAVEHYFIQSKENFNAWKLNPRSNSSVIKSFRIDNSSCIREVYDVSVEDQYFVVFRLIQSDRANVNVTITFNRTKFAVSEEDQIERRYFNTSTSGSITTPINRNRYILLVYGNSSEPPEYWNLIPLNIDVICDSRVWLYAVVTAGPVALVLCITVTICCVCCVYRSKRRSAEGNPLLWDVETESHSYHKYSDRLQKLDPLTEMAINNASATNPHIVHFDDNIKPPSFQDNDVIVGSPKFSTFKP